MSDETGQGPTTPYRSGDLEAAARAAREEAARQARERAAAIRAEAEAEAAERAAPAPPADQQVATPAIEDVPARRAAADAPAAVGAGAAAASTSSSTNPSASASTREPEEPVEVPTVDADPVPVPGKNGSNGSVLAFFRELPVLLAVAFLLAFLLRTFVVQVFYIPSGSMIPTLEVNDRIVVEKISYLFREPERGEIVVFEGDEVARPVEESTATKISRGIGQFLGIVPANARDFVKRVIGLPGDEIVITDGVVTVNGVELEEPYAVEDLRDFGPFVVPEGKLFFLGDNRPSSADSRIESALGYVDRDQVVGRAMVIVWPFEHFDGLGTPDYGPIPER